MFFFSSLHCVTRRFARLHSNTSRTVGAEYAVTRYSRVFRIAHPTRPGRRPHFLDNNKNEERVRIFSILRVSIVSRFSSCTSAAGASSSVSRERNVARTPTNDPRLYVHRCARARRHYNIGTVYRTVPYLIPSGTTADVSGVENPEKGSSDAGQ